MSAPIDFTPGRWAVCRGSMPLYTEILKIARATERQVHSGDRRPRVMLKSAVLATYATYPEAERLRDTIAGIRGERDRRITAASTWAEREVARHLGRE